MNPAIASLPSLDVCWAFKINIQMFLYFWAEQNHTLS